ncbi:transcriptional regulator [Streptacidiphilus pinicola]|uniref:Transcriptional regulator n=1 Tax=Streptacidiphilus pinicola TaxID=2219663 RepID=A0A2X0I7I8_9ACTN|nr:helix-turn-helix domain-containing protein [Streptacidiphilus pinicola]RAG80557.1 transcriptional regulator [Streptacidiphilus pinicola]
MISFVLSVVDLADTRFAVSPVHETLMSLRILQDPSLSALHLPWRRSVLGRLGALDTDLLMSLVARRRTIPDFLTPNPTEFAPAFADELALVRRTPVARVRHDLLLAHAPDPLPPALLDAAPETDDTRVAALRDEICDLLQRYWELAVEPYWPQIRLVVEADMTYRARRLAVGGARLLFSDMHPNLRWDEGVLRIDQMIGHHEVAAAGRGLLLMPSVFSHKPAPPVSPHEAPSLVYPCRGTATLWGPAPAPAAPALVSLLGAPRARLLSLLEEPLPTVELARRLRVTPSAVSQHLQVLFATGLVTRARHGRQVLYRRTSLGDQLSP